MTATAKAALRRLALQARGQGGDAMAATVRLMAALRPYSGKVLAGYWPIRTEADPREAMKAHDGPVCLPVVVGPDQPLVFRGWDGGALDLGAFGTRHPPESAPVLRPDVLIVPLVGFDHAGNRLGYGAGHYDRTLEILRMQGPVTAIGFAYAVQELPAIPPEATDQVLNMIVTDREVIRP